MTTFIEEQRLDRAFTDDELSALLLEGLGRSGRDLSRLAVVPTDKTRLPGRAGFLTQVLYRNRSATLDISDIFIALGSHSPHTALENQAMFGEVPQERFQVHDWKQGVTQIGVVPEAVVSEYVGEGWAAAIPVQVNTDFIEGLDGAYSAAVSIGPVFPHEVAGFSNGLKNILVGLGGKGFIDASHYLGASYGIERIMGRLRTPVRRVFDYAHEHFLAERGIIYALTVLDNDGKVRGFFVGDDIDTHRRAADLSKELNVTAVEALERAVVYCDPEEFTSFWLCCKAVYRTRMAMQEGGELVVIAPGLRSYVDDPQKNPQMDALLQNYGYRGKACIMDAVEVDPELKANLSVAAHLMHGSPDNRFDVTFATDPARMSDEAVKRVGFNWMHEREARQHYKPEGLSAGYHLSADKGRFYFVPNPASVLLTKEG